MIKERQARGLILARQRLFRTVIPRVRRQVSAFARNQRTEVIRLVTEKTRYRDLEDSLDGYDWSGQEGKLIVIVTALHRQVGNGAGRQLEELLGIGLDFGTAGDPQLERTIHAIMNRADGIGSVQGRVKREVVEQVRLGAEHGLTFRQIAEGGTFEIGAPGAKREVTVKGIRGVYSDLETWQAQRIARTESAVGYNRSSSSAMREAGIQLVDVSDGDKDDDCAAANGAVWTVDYYDSNPIGHPNCTRIGLPRFEPTAEGDIVSG